MNFKEIPSNGNRYTAEKTHSFVLRMPLKRIPPQPIATACAESARKVYYYYYYCHHPKLNYVVADVVPCIDPDYA
jgi:hypothetical protein